MLNVETFFDKDTFTLTYIVFDSQSKDAIIIDPVWDYDLAASRLSGLSLQRYREFIIQNQLNLHYILETHAHADHVSSAQEIKKIFTQTKVAIGQKITLVQETFKKIFNLPEQSASAKDFDLLLEDGEELKAGSINIKAHHTPGHTPACVTYEIENYLFTGDALFLPDSGTGRCDFPQGSAEDLYHSITQKIFNMPEHYFIMVGHDYQIGGRGIEWQSTVGESKRTNVMLRQGMTKAEFVEKRKMRDLGLGSPRLLFPSILLNMHGGRAPAPEDNGRRYLKIPLNMSNSNRP